MKGILIGLFYFIWGIFSGIVLTVYYVLSTAPVKDLYQYLTLLVLGLVGFVLYVIAASRYVNRRRPTTESEESNHNPLLYDYYH